MTDSKSVQPESTLLLKSEVFENLSLHLDDVEFLRNAFVVQATLGPLVRFSNRGRYEPYVAKSWTQNENNWSFRLHDGLACEDGEPINPHTFRKSLIGSLKRFKEDEIQQTPFAHLSGIQELISNGKDEKIGIHATSDELILAFNKPVGKALLEYLAMSPFAFLCGSNFQDGKWKSREYFVSSGAYRVSKFDPKTSLVTLELRKDWPLAPPSAFQKVFLSNQDHPELKPTATIEMSYMMPKRPADGSALVYEVPRALLSVRTGIQDGAYFAEKKNRQALRSAVNQVLRDIEIPFENYHRAESFFFGQMSGHEAADDQGPTPSASGPPKPLKVRAAPIGALLDSDFYQQVLFQALDKLGWKYELMSAPVVTAQSYFDHSYDLSFDRSHVDATLDPDFVRLLFKSNLGPRYQDPGGRISKLVDNFDKGSLTYRDFLIGFNTAIYDEAAILPLFHRGFTFKCSSNINPQSMSPLMSILRYEELTLKANGSH